MVESIRHSPIASLRRIRFMATQTLAAALHLQLAWLLAAAGTMLVLMARWLQFFNFGALELKFIADFGLGAVGLMGTLLAALATAHLFFEDLAHGAAGWVLTRPVRRWEFVVGKLTGVMALLALFVGALLLVLVVVIVGRARQLGVAYGSLAAFLQAGALMWFKISLVAAMTLLVCSYAGSALFASSAGLLLAVAGHLRPFTEPIGWLSVLRAWPNLALFHAEPLLQDSGLAASALGGLAGYWLLFLVILAGLASYVFQHREF